MVTAICRLAILFHFVLCISSLTSVATHLRQQRQAPLTAYNEQYAKLMAVLSAGAYAPSPNACISRWMPDAHVWRVHTLANQACDELEQTCASYTLVSDYRREIVVVFRGTKSQEQLFLEGWQSLKPGVDFFNIGQVNKYFFQALEVLWPTVRQSLADPNMAGYSVTFTGHSLGGALAALGAARAVLEGLRGSNQIRLYTFGEPRVGNSAFAFRHDQLVPHSFRVVFRSDIVPHLPPCLKNMSYTPGQSSLRDEDNKPCDPNAQGIAYHHGTEIWYPRQMPKIEASGPTNGDERYYECVGAPRDEDYSCSDSLSFELSKYKSYIWDHRNYFGHRIPVFGKLGCDPNGNDNSEGAARRVTTGGTQSQQGAAGGESGGTDWGKRLANVGSFLGRMLSSALSKEN